MDRFEKLADDRRATKVDAEYEARRKAMEWYTKGPGGHQIVAYGTPYSNAQMGALYRDGRASPRAVLNVIRGAMMEFHWAESEQRQRKYYHSADYLNRLKSLTDEQHEAWKEIPEFRSGHSYQWEAEKRYREAHKSYLEYMANRKPRKLVEINFGYTKVKYPMEDLAGGYTRSYYKNGRLVTETTPYRLKSGWSRRHGPPPPTPYRNFAKESLDRASQMLIPNWRICLL